MEAVERCGRAKTGIGGGLDMEEEDEERSLLEIWMYDDRTVMIERAIVAVAAIVASGESLVESED